jgi:hypothetical protein
MQEIVDKAHQAKAASNNDKLIFGTKLLEQSLLVFLKSMSKGQYLKGIETHTSGSESFTGWGALLADMRATQMLVLTDEVLKGLK